MLYALVIYSPLEKKKKKMMRRNEKKIKEMENDLLASHENNGRPLINLNASSYKS